jgi:hypothetical protein
MRWRAAVRHVLEREPDSGAPELLVGKVDGGELDVLRASCPAYARRS